MVISQHLKFLCVFSLLSLLSQRAEARRLLPVIDGNCPNIEIIAKNVQDQELLSKVFEQTSRINLENDEGLDRYLTYSFDAELETPGFVKFILSEPEGVATLNKLYGEYATGDACEALKLSPGQLKSFALNTGVDKTKSTYVLSDFRLKYIVDLVNAGGVGAQSSLIDIIQKIAHKKQRTLDVGYDDSAIEVRDPSFRDTPNAIKNIVHVQSEDFVTPQLHLHLGLPSQVISEEEARAIAMAIETVLVLGRAAKEPGTYRVHNLEYNRGSPLADYNERGAVFLKKPNSFDGGFKDPFPAHDLEIRKADSDDQQLQFLALGIVLAKNYKRLKVDDTIKYDRAVEQNLGNVKGALLYAAKLFKRSDFSDNQRIAPLLEAIANKIIYEQYAIFYELSPDLAEEIFQFLNENQIVQRLTTNLFLKP